MYIGYARTSMNTQNLDLQLDALTKADCIKIFEEKASGKSTDRPELQKMLEMLREGDRVIVYKLDRISRSTKDLIELIELFKEKGVEFVSLTENIDTSTPTGTFFLQIMAALAELERERIRERTYAGLEAARARGKKGGRPKIDDKTIKKALKLYDSKTHSVAEISKITGVSRQTLYRYLKKREGK